MPRSLTRAVLTVVVTAVALVAAGLPARATDPVWITASCATGTLTSAQSGGQHNAVVFGSASWCGAYVENSQFAIVNFTAGLPTTVVLSYNMRNYNPNGPQSFGAQVTDLPGTYGTCVVASRNQKLACAKVTLDPFGSVSFESISIDDTLVSAAIEDYQVAEDPRCGSCF